MAVFDEILKKTWITQPKLIFKKSWYFIYKSRKRAFRWYKNISVKKIVRASYDFWKIDCFTSEIIAKNYKTSYSSW